MRMALSRREFLKRSAIAGTGLVFGSACGLPTQGLASIRLDRHQPGIDLAVAKGASPTKNCLAAVEALGGFPKFVRKGDKVVIKPNPVGRRPPESAIHTHPEIVEAVVRECVKAGASEVLVVSHDGVDNATANGTVSAVERGGGRVSFANQLDQFREIYVPRGRLVQRVEIIKEVLDADLFINIPIAKHHTGSRVTLSMKNLMGINWDRQYFHATDLNRCIAELASAVRQDLVIVDANHVLMTNGPAGPGQVKVANQVIAGVDPVAVDAFCTGLFDLEPDMVPHIRHAYDLGIGEIDLSRLKIKEFSV